MSVSVLKAEIEGGVCVKSIAETGCLNRQLTIAISGLRISGSRGITLNVSGGYEDRVLEWCTGRCKILDIFESDAGGVTFAGSRAYNAFVANGCFGD